MWLSKSQSFNGSVPGLGRGWEDLLSVTPASRDWPLRVFVLGAKGRQKAATNLQ